MGDHAAISYSDLNTRTISLIKPSLIMASYHKQEKSSENSKEEGESKEI